MNKVFIVGCSRSGTSVIQKKIVDKLDVWSLPETSFLIHSNENPENRLRNLKRLIDLSEYEVADSSTYSYISSAFEVCGKKETLDYLFSDLSPSTFLKLFLSAVAKLKGYPAWIEKSPTHYQSTGDILEQDKSSWVIFVVRNGLDVAGSIRDRAIKNPDYFSNQFRVEYGLNLWNDSVKNALKFKDHSNFIVISYEAFCENPDKIVNDVQTKIGLSARHGSVSELINTVGKGEGWKSDVGGEISRSNSKISLFTDSEIELLKEKLHFDYLSELEAISI